MSFTVYNETYRNLIEQVQKNKEDIANHYNIDRVLADFGIKIIGQVSDVSQLPDPATFDGDYGDAYAVGQSEPYSFYVWTRADVNAGHPNDYWFNIGPLAIVGPKGPKGDKGDKGDKGNPAKWISAGTQPILTGEILDGTQFLNTSNGNVYEASSYPNGSRYWKLTGNIKGPQGVQGINGPVGPQGEQGPQGPKGDKGDVGGFINILGIVNNTSQLPTPASLNNLSKAYLVGTQEPYNLYIQVGPTSAQAVWRDMGQLNVATYVTVDGQFQNIWDADTKVNKVTDTGGLFKAYIVNRQGGQEMRTLSTTAQGNNIPMYSSAGRIQTKKPFAQEDCANKQYVDENKQLYKQTFVRYYPDEDYEDEFDKLVLITNKKYPLNYTIKNAGDYINPESPEDGKYNGDYKGIYFNPDNEFIIKAYHYSGDSAYPESHNFTITEGGCNYSSVNEVIVDDTDMYIYNTEYCTITSICGINLDDFFGGKPQTASVYPVDSMSF